MARKKEVERNQQMIDLLEHAMNNAKEAVSYLFLGKAYDRAFDEAFENIPYPNRYFIELYSINDRDFSFNELVDSCTRPSNVLANGRLVVLRLKNKGMQYQTRLLVPLQRLTLPLLVFADSDGLMDSFMSRFEQERIFKQTNENLQVAAFQTLNKVLSRPSIESPYICPSLIKLGDYDKLSPSNKRMDIIISKLSGDKVYPEMLSELQSPIKIFDSDVKLEALSLMKRRLDSKGCGHDR